MLKTIREEKIYCPLLKKEINEDVCEDATNVVDGGHPERFAPKEIVALPDWKETCRTCPNNPYNY